ncbi:bacterial accessory variability determinant protein [Candidatus Termititenax persephonae]|uniref:Bacterial accessory variability determinant protein n=1 Tax=Candidatus Termititenax persephonae TaxID=2218525 RepID=A0A388TJF8_9BACT|nr:bacterial accessory variability determinant protein [Candidatus Termititenax persephonae]
MEELSVITLTYDFARYLTPIVARFPRNQRYQLGERIENIAFDILENLLSAKYSQEKRRLLFQTNILLEKLRFFIRLAGGFQYFIQFRAINGGRDSGTYIAQIFFLGDEQFYAAVLKNMPHLLRAQDIIDDDKRRVGVQCAENGGDLLQRFIKADADTVAARYAALLQALP